MSAANDLTQKVITWLSRCGFTVWKANSGYVKANVKLSPPGTPDVIGWSPDGLFCGIEIKIDDDELRPKQVENLSAIAENGGFAAILRAESEIPHMVGAYERTRGVPFRAAQEGYAQSIPKVLRMWHEAKQSTGASHSKNEGLSPQVWERSDPSQAEPGTGVRSKVQREGEHSSTSDQDSKISGGDTK